MSTTTKMTTAERNALLCIDGDAKFWGGIAHFSGATGADLRALLDGGQANADDTQNDAPSFIEFTEWLEAHPTFRAHGYAVSESRPDCRVSVEGVEAPGPLSPEDVADFVEFQRHADEFTASPAGCRSWWD